MVFLFWNFKPISYIRKLPYKIICRKVDTPNLHLKIKLT